MYGARIPFKGAGKTDRLIATHDQLNR